MRLNWGICYFRQKNLIIKIEIKLRAGLIHIIMAAITQNADSRQTTAIIKVSTKDFSSLKIIKKN